MQAEKMGTYFGLHHASHYGIVFQVVEGLLPICHMDEKGASNNVKAFLGHPAKFIVLDGLDRGWYYVSMIGEDTNLHGCMDVRSEMAKRVKIKKIG
jgi:hypothetical protein